MKELSLNILDITMNSVKAGASLILIDLAESDDTLTVTISDNGCGMTSQQISKLRDPFFTTRTTRKVGMGVPFFVLAAEQTGGNVKITSVPEAEDSEHKGTVVKALFYKKNIDFTPLGDTVSTVCTLIQGNPDTDFVFRHETPAGTVELDTRDIKKEIGTDIPINSFEILGWIKEYLEDQYNCIKK